MAKKIVKPPTKPYAKECAALDVAYSSLLIGAGILRTAVAAIESTDEGVNRAGIWETVQAAHAQLMKANNAFDGHFESPFHKQMEAVRAPLWDVLDLVFVGAFALDSDDFPGAYRSISDSPESAPLRIAATMAAGEGLESVAARVAQLQQKISQQRSKAA